MLKKSLKMFLCIINEWLIRLSCVTQTNKLKSSNYKFKIKLPLCPLLVPPNKNSYTANSLYIISSSPRS